MQKPEIAYIGRIDGDNLDLYPQNPEAWDTMYVPADTDAHGVKHCQFTAGQCMIDLFEGQAERLGQRTGPLPGVVAIFCHFRGKS